MGTRIAPKDRFRLQALIKKRIRSFDLGALLAQLARIGICREDITFKSNSDPAPAGSIIQAIAFFESPSRRAEITLNIGLTGPNGLVPSYFQEIAQQSADPDVLDTFLHFFDHPLIECWVDALYPDSPTGALHAWPSLRNASFSMLGVGSISTLEWIFGSLFPELRVQVRRITVPMPTDAFALRAGTALLDGAGVLGVVDAPQCAGLSVDLFTEDERHDAGRKWIDLVEERFARVALPIVRPYDLTLKVVLNVAIHKSWATLEQRPEGSLDEPAAGHLGYDRVQGQSAGHQITVFEGAVRTAQPS